MMGWEVEGVYVGCCKFWLNVLRDGMFNLRIK
jgi:hypothetical protein